MLIVAISVLQMLEDMPIPVHKLALLSIVRSNSSLKSMGFAPAVASAIDTQVKFSFMLE